MSRDAQLVTLAQALSLLPANAVVVHTHRSLIRAVIGFLVVWPVVLAIIFWNWLPAQWLAPIPMLAEMPREMPLVVSVSLALIMVAGLVFQAFDWRLRAAGHDFIMAYSADRLWLKLRRPWFVLPPADKPSVLVLPRRDVIQVQPWEGWRSEKRGKSNQVYLARALDFELAEPLPEAVREEVGTLFIKLLGIKGRVGGLQPTGAGFTLSRSDNGQFLRLALPATHPNFFKLVGEMKTYWPVAETLAARDAPELGHSRYQGN
jgi:hypothetical protein